MAGARASTRSGSGALIYDVHAHCVPVELLEFLRSDGGQLGIEVVDGSGGPLVSMGGPADVGPFASVFGDLDARRTAMDAMGVDVQLLSYRTDLAGYALRAHAGACYARSANSILSQHAARHPRRFLALGTVPLQAPRAAAEELRHAVEELGMVGVEIGATVNGVTLDRAGLDAFWEAAAHLRCLVLLHPAAPLAGLDLGRFFLETTFGRPAETTLSVSSLLLSGLFDRYPDLVLCVVHGGGFLPYQLGRMDKAHSAVPELAAQRVGRAPSELARLLYYDSLVYSPLALRFLVDLVGAQHVVLGTDYPYEMHERLPVAQLHAVPSLTGDDRATVQGGNVERILRDIRR